MNYKRIYFNIIRNRLNNPLPKDIYGENHHIIPLSFGGINCKRNLVRLMAREHYLAHFLLYKIFKQRVNNIFLNSFKENSRFKKMTFAFQMMLDASNDNQKRHYGLINSKIFEQLRDCSKLQKNIPHNM